MAREPSRSDGRRNLLVEQNRSQVSDDHPLHRRAVLRLPHVGRQRGRPRGSGAVGGVAVVEGRGPCSSTRCESSSPASECPSRSPSPPPRWPAASTSPRSRNYVPCTLCWYQRIGMYSLAIILLVAAIRRDRGIRPYGITLALVGAADLRVPLPGRVVPDRSRPTCAPSACRARSCGSAASGSSPSPTWPVPGSRSSPWCSPSPPRKESA